MDSENKVGLRHLCLLRARCKASGAGGEFEHIRSITDRQLTVSRATLPADWRDADVGIPFTIGFVLDPCLRAEVTYMSPGSKLCLAMYKDQQYDSLGNVVVEMSRAWQLSTGADAVPRN